MIDASNFINTKIGEASFGFQIQIFFFNQNKYFLADFPETAENFGLQIGPMYLSLLWRVYSISLTSPGSNLIWLLNSLGEWEKKKDAYTKMLN